MAKVIYIDSDFRCHISNPDGEYISVETNFFYGKCQEYIEGYRYVPAGQSWTRSDGAVFEGEMIAPLKDWKELDDAQREYELQQIAAYEAALSEIEKALGVSV